MTEEEQVLAEAANIIEQANTKQANDYIEYVTKAALQLEEQLWQEYGVQEGYALWRLAIAHQGTPESVEAYGAELLANNEQVEKVDVGSHGDMEPNSVMRMEIAYFAQDGMPDNIKDLLRQAKYMVKLHNDDGFHGLVARTGAWASSDTSGVKPSEASDKESITLTVVAMAGLMLAIPRSDSTGKRYEDKVMPINYFTPSSKEDALMVKACHSHLENEYGEMASAMYAAIAFPQMIKMADPEMFAASLKDLDRMVTGSDDTPSSDKPTGDKQ
jgi:hypothetical protein